MLINTEATVIVSRLCILSDSDCRISANTILCFCCGLRAFKELAYKYRQNIPASELPGPSNQEV